MVSFNIDAIMVANFAIAVLLPLLVGLITNRMTQSSAKVLLLAGLTTVTSLLGEAVRAWQAGEAYDLGTALFTLFMALALAWGAYTNVWKPTGAAVRVQEVGMSPEKIALANQEDVDRG